MLHETSQERYEKLAVIESGERNKCMDLLTNAIESIRVGVEDYETGTQPRLLSAARNIHAGILLLYKEALKRESPNDTNDVLMMAEIIPIRDARGIVFVGHGTKTVDVRQIKERLNGIGFVTEWKRFERINKVRNEVEHLHPSVDQKALRGLISDSFILIRNFIADELNEDPLVLLGEETWQTMLEVAEVYQKEKQGCEQFMAQVKWISPALIKGLADLTCSNCGSDLLRPEVAGTPYTEVSLECISCGKTEDADSYIPKAIASALRLTSYEAAKDGG